MNNFWTGNEGWMQVTRWSGRKSLVEFQVEIKCANTGMII